MSGPDPAWRELTPEEAAALQPISIDVEGLGEADIAQVDEEARTMFANSVIAFFREFQRQPNDAEVRMLAGAVARYMNQHVVPELHARRTIH